VALLGFSMRALQTREAKFVSWLRNVGLGRSLALGVGSDKQSFWSCDRTGHLTQLIRLEIYNNSDGAQDSAIPRARRRKVGEGLVFARGGWMFFAWAMA
jgi:hypothetical protein